MSFIEILVTIFFIGVISVCLGVVCRKFIKGIHILFFKPKLAPKNIIAPHPLIGSFKTGVSNPLGSNIFPSLGPTKPYILNDVIYDEGVTKSFIEVNNTPTTTTGDIVIEMLQELIAIGAVPIKVRLHPRIAFETKLNEHYKDGHLLGIPVTIACDVEWVDLVFPKKS